MKRALHILLLLLVIGGAFLGGSWSARRATSPNTPPTRKILYYVDPMHPSYKSDKPGIAPDCGMELVPVYEEASANGASGAPAEMPPGTVSVSPDRQQLIGVKLATVDTRSGTHTLRVLGRVASDETRVYRINASTDGWVTKILPVTTDSLVQKDELLAAFYAPEFNSPLKAYLVGLHAIERSEASRKENRDQFGLATSGLDIYRNSLRILGMTEYQLNEIQRTRQGGENVEIRAPEAGFVLTRNLTLGERFQRGTELFRIADLSRVWIVADTYGTEAATLQPGRPVGVSAPHLGKKFVARVAHVPPSFDAATRTLRVRLEVDNPGLLLRPDMFVDVELPMSLPPGIAVPVDAVMDSGVKKTVYVDQGNGIFTPREVETGWRYGDRVEIVAGLKPGERIVISGTFLVDSESRMKASSRPVAGSGQEPSRQLAGGRGQEEPTKGSGQKEQNGNMEGHDHHPGHMAGVPAAMPAASR